MRNRQHSNRSYAKAVTALLTAVFFVGLYWAYLGRVELVDSQRRSCQRVVADRTSNILVRATQAWATQRVASDPDQPARTRQALRLEADVERQAIADLLPRVDQRSFALIVRSVPTDAVRALVIRLDRGRRLDCAQQFPDAHLLP